jgi:hypothetical protein
MNELSVIQKTYDLIKWYVPILNRLPRNHRFTLAERIINTLYGVLEGLIRVRYARSDKISTLNNLNTEIDVLRYQTRLLYDFQLISVEKYEYVNQSLNEIGREIGGWIKQKK